MTRRETWLVAAALVFAAWVLVGTCVVGCHRPRCPLRDVAGFADTWGETDDFIHPDADAMRAAHRWAAKSLDRLGPGASGNHDGSTRRARRIFKMDDLSYDFWARLEQHCAVVLRQNMKVSKTDNYYLNELSGLSESAQVNILRWIEGKGLECELLDEGHGKVLSVWPRS